MASKKKVESKKIEKKKVKEKTSKKNDKQVMIILAVMVGLIILLILFFVIRVNSNSFTHNNIEFRRTKYGDIQLYTSKVPILDSYGNVKEYLEIDFRNDPRELDYINVDIDKILFNQGLALLSVDDAEKCPDNGIALINFGGLFLREAGVATKLTYLNQSRAEKEGVPYVTCNNTKTNTVLEIKEGNETSITQTAKNCYELTYSNCEIMMVTEKFQLEMLEKHMDSIL